VEHYLPFVTVVDACAIPGTDEAYALLEDGRIVRTGDDLEGPALYRRKGGFDRRSKFALSPDGSTLALVHRGENPDWNSDPPFGLVLVSTRDGSAHNELGAYYPARPCWSSDGRSLLLVGFDSPERKDSWIVRHILDSNVEDERLAAGRYVLLTQAGELHLSDWGSGHIAVASDGTLILASEADGRLPPENSGLFMAGPAHRGGISARDPRSGIYEPLFVGVIPISVQWRWED
jgi:hypothetical protein